MNKREFDILQGNYPGNITAEEIYNKLWNKKPRILLYGYTISRKSFVIELNFDGKICKYVDDIEISFNNINDCVPSKRVYPAKSDFEFCKLLQSYGIDIPFTYFE